MQRTLAQTLANIYTESGKSLHALAEESPILIIFLRHFGCTFCRRTIHDISDLRRELANRGVRPVFIHLGPPELAKSFFDYYHLSNVERVSNPDASIFQSAPFAIPRLHPIRWLFTPKVLYGWLSGAIFKHGISSIDDDGYQMPGIFFIKDGRIANTFHYKTIADQPDYLKLIS